MKKSLGSLALSDEGIPSNEAINFQFNSKLAKAIIPIIQRGIDEYNRLYANVTKFDISTNSVLANKMLKYTKSFIVLDLQKAILQHTNIHIREVRLDLWNRGVDPYPLGLFAIDVALNDLVSSVHVSRRMSGIYNDNLDAKEYKLLQDFETITKNFDPDSTKLKSNVFGKNKNKHISVTLFFDTLTAFCMGGYIPDKLVKPLTAEEITAVLLHEIGHVHSIVERASDLYFTQDRISIAIRELKDGKMDIDRMSRLLPSMSRSIDLLAKQNKIPKELNELTSDVLNKVTEVISEKDKHISESFASKFVDLMTLVLGAILSCIAIILGKLFWLNYLADIGTGLESSIITAFGNNSPNKASDTRTTIHNLHVVERLADEFVSRNGMSASLGAALTKLVNYDNYTQEGLLTVNSRAMRKSVLVANMLRVVYGLTVITNWSKEDSTTYENIDDRILRMGQNTLKVFKQSGLPEDMIKSYIKDYEEITAIAKKAKSWSKNPIIGLLQSMLNKLSPPVFFRILVNGNLNGDYKKLADTLDKLTSNKFYYQSKKFLNI